MEFWQDREGSDHLRRLVFLKGANSQLRCQQVPTRSSSLKMLSLQSPKKPNLCDSPLSILQNLSRKLLSISYEDFIKIAFKCGFSSLVNRQLVHRASEYRVSSTSLACVNTTDWLLKGLPMFSFPYSSITAISSSLQLVQSGTVPLMLSKVDIFSLVTAELVVRMISLTKS